MDYADDISAKMDTLTFNKVYKINLLRPDLEAFRDAIKARIDCKGDFQFTDDYTGFKRIKPFYDEVAEIAETNEPIDWHGMVKAIHDQIDIELDIQKYVPKKRW